MIHILRFLTQYNKSPSQIEHILIPMNAHIHTLPLLEPLVGGTSPPTERTFVEV